VLVDESSGRPPVSAVGFTPHFTGTCQMAQL
jgi:hypothetical protein